MQNDHLLINDLKSIFQQYSEWEFIDKGGFKSVFKAKLNGETEAIKLVKIPSFEDLQIKPELKEDFIQEAKKRLIREVNLLGKCKCPYIVKLGKLTPTELSIKSDSFIAYSEEFLEGNNLYKIINSEYIPGEQELIQLLICLIESIFELWGSFQTIHRDIKPLNVFKTNNKNRPFVLLDLGIAYVLNETPLTVNASNRLPQGTIKYLAPEMLSPSFRGSFDFRSDLYNSGVVCYEYATQKHPLVQNESDLILTLSKIIRENPKPIEFYRDDLSKDICEIINQLIKKMVALRPGNIPLLLRKLKGIR